MEDDLKKMEDDLYKNLEDELKKMKKMEDYLQTFMGKRTEKKEIYKI